jgi:hypothetical protein
MAFVGKMNISPGYISDHSIIEITLSLLDFDKGRGFWKFNNSLLRDDNYIKLVKDTIDINICYTIICYTMLYVYNIMFSMLYVQ